MITKLSHNLIKEKLIELTNQTINKKCSLNLACIETLFTILNIRKYNLWSCKKVCDALHFILANLSIKWKLYRQIVSIPMGTSCKTKINQNVTSTLSWIYLNVIWNNLSCIVAYYSCEGIHITEDLLLYQSCIGTHYN